MPESIDAAPVLWGMVLELVALARAELVAVRDRVAEETVELTPADGLMVAEAWTLETLARALLRAAEADEAADAAADEAEARRDETATEADEATAAEPPVRPNWAE